MVYGLHASLERMLGFAEDLNQYGAITIPDLPGFGGMDSFYTIGETPTLDNMADYLASFIRLRYRRKRVTIMGMSYGFLVVTRMLQKYPDIAKKTDLLVSLVGFVHHDDFKMKKLNFMFIDLSARIGRRRLPAWIIKTFIFRGPVLRLSYKLVAKKHRKLQSADPAEIKRRVDFEIMLWKINDARTRAKVSYDAFRVNLCNQQVDLPVYHVAIADDHFFDNHIVEQHMRIIYKGFERIDAVIDGKHAPTVIADAKTAAPYVPKKLRRLLTKQK
jgi:pimeloyl-ACP methyl ester carboxylesterase